MADLRDAEGGHTASYRNRTLGMWVVLLLSLGAFAGATGWQALHHPTEAPGFTLASTGYEGGAQGDPVRFSLADYRGRVLVLDLMAVACAPCRTVTEEVVKPLAEGHGGDPRFAILSVDTWADPATG
ncbi:MAG TPA: hypothetical protein VI796_02225, partial [Candidatus Thermoplasmatota archaeon]|nr:hypothetical protein [Candidatus Thermoplasmatota archaeon]